MRTLKQKKKNIIILLLSVLLTVGLVLTGVITDVLYSKAEDGIPTIKDTVVFAGVKYTKDMPLKVLEILPDESLAEVGYLSGINQGDVKWSDIVLLPDSTPEEIAAKKLVRDEFFSVLTNLDGGPNCRIELKKKKDADIDDNWKIYSEITNTNLFSEDDYDNAEIRICYQNANTNWQFKPYCYLNEEGKKVYTTNIFAYSIFQGYDMCDKLQVDLIKASEVTEAMMDQYTLVYINSGRHVGISGSKQLSQYMYDAYSVISPEQIGKIKFLKEYKDVSEVAVAVGSYGNLFQANGQDVSAEVALKLIYQINRKGISAMYDVNAFPTQDYNTYNLAKVYLLSTNIARDTLYEEYLENYDATTGIYSGLHGRIQIDIEDTHILNLYMDKTTEYGDYVARDPKKAVDWKPGMFVWSPYSNGETDVYYNVSAGLFVNDNFYTYNGNNSVGVGFVNDSVNVNDRPGTTHSQISSMYGDIYNNVKCPLLVQYVIGGYRTYQPITQIRVLEINPAGASKYNDFADALKLAQYMGVSFPDMTADNYTEKVKIKSVASNGFIAMTDDLKNAYDLIVVTDYNTADSGNPIIKNNMIYSEFAEKMTLDEKLDGKSLTAAMSGNDFTDKALNKIYEYLKTGKPMVLADSIYTDTLLPTTTFTEDKSDVNVYKLSEKSLKAQGISTANVLREPEENDTSYEKLKYLNSPIFTMGTEENKYKDYKVDYDDENNNIVNATVDISTLGHYTMTGKIGNYSDYYNMTIWFDKDGDGLFTSSTTGDSELYLDQEIHTNGDGTFSVTIELPENMRRYVKWKAVAKAYGSEYGTEDTGAIAIKYAEEEKKPVHVLQIIPGDSTNLDMSADSAFDKLFEASSDVTGLDLTVTQVKSDDFKNWYGSVDYKDDGSSFNNPEKNKLKDYDMVVIGFADNFNDKDIASDNAMRNLKDFIDRGKSVLFTHDTMIYSAYSDGKVSNKTFKKDGDTYKTALRITSKFRDIVGQDRYHASTGNNKSDYQQGFTNAFLMKRANLNGNKYEMYSDLADGASAADVTITTDSVSKLNTGQVTEYPYKVSDILPVAETHAQWFQLDLEAHNDDYSDSNEDVVVWYTLNSSEEKRTVDSVISGTLGKTGNSWGKVSPSGSGGNNQNYFMQSSEPALYYNSNANGQIPNDGQYMMFKPSTDGRLQLRVLGGMNGPTTYKVIRSDGVEVISQKCDSNFDREISTNVLRGYTYYIYGVGDGWNYRIRMRSMRFVAKDNKNDWTEWSYSTLHAYVTGVGINSYPPSTSSTELKYPYSNYYALSGKDALNNYYIYSKGNITYSGAGHAPVTGEDELKLFVNTVVKAYGSLNNAPDIQVDNAVSLGSNVYEKYLRSLDDYRSSLTSDDEKLLREGSKITFTATDIDMGASTTTGFQSGDVYWDVNGNGAYDNGDIVLKQYGVGEINNKEKNNIYLYDYKDIPNGQFLNALKAGTVKIGIRVFDNMNLSGQCTVNVIARELFKLE